MSEPVDPHGPSQGRSQPPQCSELLEVLTHSSPHRVKPGLQAKPQAAASQVAVALAGTGQGVQAAPQVATLLLLTHASLQTCWPLGQAAHCPFAQTWVLVQQALPQMGRLSAHLHLPGPVKGPPSSM